ncbi:MAG: UxaA family hydrolase [Acidobacteria bacterium]|nr:UxaA family hydrolase [Acidobacteriota bacterium]
MKAVLVISERDNVATALEPLEIGRRVDANGATVVASEMIAAGHKIALHPIAAGHPVIKYGSPIGLASRDIAPGAHVHTHNLASSRGRGDLEPQPPASEARLAEPSDQSATPFQADAVGYAGPDKPTFADRAKDFP